MHLPLDLLRQRVAQHPRPLLFATISGAHLYGFPSPDSDFDLRGVHLCPLPEVLGLTPERDTIEIDNKPTMAADGIEFDIVSHDAKKFFTLLLRKNGYVLEQLYSPLIVHTSPAHEELKAIARNCITRHHAHHYLGFADTQWRLFEKENPRRAKPLLYTYRVLLTGIHLMRTGQIEANLLTLNEDAKLPQLPDLIARKLAGPEQSTLPNADLPFHTAEIQRLTTALEHARDQSALPDAPTAQPALHDLLVRLRLNQPQNE
jgi:predicted nucleotidyltransferase